MIGMKFLLTASFDGVRNASWLVRVIKLQKYQVKHKKYPLNSIPVNLRKSCQRGAKTIQLLAYLQHAELLYKITNIQSPKWFYRITLGSGFSQKSWVNWDKHMSLGTVFVVTIFRTKSSLQFQGGQSYLSIRCPSRRWRQWCWSHFATSWWWSTGN